MGEIPDETRGNRVDFPLRNGDCRASGVGMEFSEESRRMSPSNGCNDRFLVVK